MMFKRLQPGLVLKLYLSVQKTGSKRTVTQNDYMYLRLPVEERHIRGGGGGRKNIWVMVRTDYARLDIVKLKSTSNHLFTYLIAI